ncbi:hypothetical protein [Vampirovibrio sp.]|uniref:hypothetical protein n=1 Tax=Vampirovibrio sp. TaxID=2717857 RepID=UPI003593CA1A
MMNKRFLYQWIALSITAAVGFCLFSEWGVAEKTVQAEARYQNPTDLEILKNDLNKLDNLASDGLWGEASVIVGQDIRARDIYTRYVEKAAKISGELLKVGKRLSEEDATVSLQQLGAICQKVSLTNTRFKNTFQHGEEQFQTYQLIQKAIGNLESAISYWRVSNRYRKIYRGGARERLEDDEILKTKLLTATNAIDELKTIMTTQEALSRNLEEE